MRQLPQGQIVGGGYAQAQTEQEQMNLTLSQYVEMVLKEHFENGGKNMANGTTRTLA